MRPRLPGIGLGAAAAAVLLSGCGSSEFRYVKNAEHATYYKVPTSWHQVDEVSLRSVFAKGDETPQGVAFLRQTQWMTGFDADPSPDVSHLFATTLERPAAFASVRTLLPAERGIISLDAMRNQLFNITELQKQRETMYQQDPLGAVTRSPFEMISNEELTGEGGARGVRVVFNIRPGEGQPMQTVDQTSYLSGDGSTLHFFFVRCSTTCYAEQRDQMDEVASSFTVRKPRS